MGSYYEGHIWKQMFPDDPGINPVSTVHLFAQAAIQGQPFVVIDRSNMAQALANITGLGDDTRADIVNSVLAGNTVTTHSMPINMGDWRGFGYVVFNPQTFSSVYMIDGGPRGGSTGCGCGGDDSQAHNSFIDTARYAGSSTNASVEPNEEEDDDEDSCDYIKNILITCLQSINDYLIDLELKGISKIIAKGVLTIIGLVIDIIEIIFDPNLDVYQKVGFVILTIVFFAVAIMCGTVTLAFGLVAAILLSLMLLFGKKSAAKMNKTKPKQEPEKTQASYIRYALYSRLNKCNLHFRCLGYTDNIGE